MFTALCVLIWVPLHGNFELHSLGVAMGNAVQNSCLKHTYIKTPPVGRWQPMTSLPARPQYKGRRENTSSTFFVFTNCFVWSVQSGKSTVFSLLSWRTLARRLRSVWIRVLVIWHPMTHTIFASFVWAKSTHAMSLRGKSACTMSLFFYEKAPLSSVPLFEERGAAVCFPRFGTHRCRGTEVDGIVGFAVGSGRWVREGPPLFVSVGREREWAAGLWWCDLSDVIRFGG